MLGHPLGSPCQRERDGRQEGLGHQGHGDPDAEDQRVGQRPPRHHHDDEEEQSHAERDQGDEPHDPAKCQGERRGDRACARGQPRDGGQLGLGAGPGDDGVRIALDHEAAAHDRITHGPRDGPALAGGHRRVDAQGRAAQDVGIGGDAIARLKPQHVTGHHVLRIDLDRPRVTHDDRPAGQERPQSLRRAIRPAFLDEGEQSVDDDDARDGQREWRKAREQGKGGCPPQHEGEEVRELPGELPQGGRPVGPRHGVGTDLLQEPGGLGRGEPGSCGHALPSPRGAPDHPPASGTGGGVGGQHVVTPTGRRAPRRRRRDPSVTFRGSVARPAARGTPSPARPGRTTAGRSGGPIAGATRHRHDPPAPPAGLGVKRDDPARRVHRRRAHEACRTRQLTPQATEDS